MCELTIIAELNKLKHKMSIEDLNKIKKISVDKTSLEPFSRNKRQNVIVAPVS